MPPKPGAVTLQTWASAGVRAGECASTLSSVSQYMVSAAPSHDPEVGTLRPRLQDMECGEGSPSLGPQACLLFLGSFFVHISSG